MDTKSGTPKIALIQNLVIIILSSEALDWLTEKSVNSFVVYNGDIRNSVRAALRQKIKKIVLTTTSNEIINIADLIIDHPDVKFVSPSSTLPNLRGAYKNLYFTSPDNSYITWIASTQKPFGFVVVYEGGNDPYVADILAKYQSVGIRTVDVTDPSWRSEPNLTVVSVTPDLWGKVFTGMIPSIQYNIYGFELYPPTNLAIPSNVINIGMFFPYGTTIPLLGSQWNYLSRNPRFSNCDQINGAYPFLLNQSWTRMEKYSLMSTIFRENSHFVSRYLPLYNIDMTVRSTTLRAKPEGKYIWLIAEEYVNRYSQANLQFISSLPTIGRAHV